MNITGVCRVLAVSGIVAGMMGVPAAQASPIEHAVDAADVSTGYVNLAYGDHTVNAALGNALEVDSYRFSANAGDQIKLLFRSTGYMDPSVQLRDSTGTLVKSATCGGGYYGCSSSFDQTIATTGIYTLNISDSGGDEGGDYELHLEQYPPVNNWVGFAYGVPPTDTIDHATDVDAWAFQGAVGTGARFSIRSNGYADPTVEIWDPSGASFRTLSCGGGYYGCTASADFDFSMGGIYKVAVHDGGLDEGGSYTLGVNCLYGSCSLSAPAPVPEPETYALMLAGLGLIGFMVRRRA